MALADNDQIPTDISMAQAYSRIRDWYQNNVGVIHSRGIQRDYARRSTALIVDLPPADKTSDLEKRAVFREVMAGLLEWGYHESDGEFKMAAYVRGATQAAGLDWQLTADEERELRSSPLWPLITAGLMESQNDADTVNTSTGSATSYLQHNQERSLSHAEIQQLDDELTAAFSIDNGDFRVERLLQLAPDLPENLLERVINWTSSESNESLRGLALAGLAPYLNGNQLNSAILLAKNIYNDGVSSTALGVLGQYLSPQARTDLIQGIRDNISSAKDRLNAWKGLAPFLSSDLKQEAISTALTLPDELQRSNALIALAPHLPDVWKMKALESARTIANPYLKVSTLSSLIPFLPKRERADTLDEALKLAREIGFEGDKADALITLSPLMPDDLKSDLFKETHKAILFIDDPIRRTEAAIRLAETVPPQQGTGYLRANALDLKGYTDDKSRGEALMTLARLGPADLHAELLNAAKGISDPQVRSSVIIQLQSIMDQEAATPEQGARPDPPQGSYQQGDYSPASSEYHEQQLPTESLNSEGVGQVDILPSYDSNVTTVSDTDTPPLPDPYRETPRGKGAPRKKPPKVEATVIDEPYDPLPADESVNTKTYLHSDRWTLDDQLNYSIYAGAIAEFILHPDTKPPLAIGILAPWGQGKTTLMKLIQNQLQLKAKQEPVTTTGMVAPPLSTSVTFAYLSKWLQDPKYELAVPKLEYPTVWFNAWKYQNSEQLWAGMAYSILSQLVGQIGNQAEREKFWLALQAERVDFNAIRQDIHRMVFEGVAPWIGISIILAVIGVVVIVVGYFAGSGIWGAGSGGVVMLAGVLLPAIKWLVARAKIKSKPLEGKFARYVRQPTYEGKLGFFHEIETDVQRVFKLLIAEGKPVVVFIDDLDRCSPGTVAQVIEAMNLFLSADFPDCYFVVGMDAQVVAASMEVAYENLDKKMKTVTRSYGSLGWYFMDKFIQLQFSIPNMTPGQRGIYLTKLFGQEVNKKQVIPEAELDNIEKNIEQSLNSPALKAEQLSQQAEQVAKFRLQRPTVHQRLSNKIVTVSAQKLSDDNPSLQKHIERYEPFLGVSPRGIKRFSNLYRFYNLSQITRRTQGLPSCSQSALARWLVIMLRWPQLVRWIQWEGEAKISAGASALNKAEAFEEQLVKTETHSAWVKYLTDLDKDYAEWMGDKQLYEFLKTTARPSEKLSLAVETGVW